MKTLNHLFVVVLLIALSACGEQGKGPDRPNYTSPNPGSNPADNTQK